jgi:phage shock protein PspC (stress-responsive transcriptional regulator)
MNKTVSIHIQGFPFTLEEQAYETLQQYLKALKEILINEPGGDEILQDVELRIVELFQECQKVPSSVILQTNIEEVIAVLGSPENFGEATSEKQDSTQTTSEERHGKRFFRDTESAIIGGVASGVAAYFHIDVVFVRAILVLFTMAFGSGIPLYILLWIITPSAQTASEKLQMRGLPVNFESIKSEFKGATERVEKNAKKWSSQFRRDSALSKGLRQIVLLIKKVIGILLVLWGLFSLIHVCLFLFVDPAIIPAQVNGNFTSLGELGSLFFETKQLTNLAYFGISIVLFSIAFTSILLGFRMLFFFNRKWFSRTILFFGVTFLGGVLLLGIVGLQTLKSFTIDGAVSAEVSSISADSLQLEIDADSYWSSTSKYRVSNKNGLFKPSKNPDQWFLFAENGRIYKSGIAITYTTSTDSLFHISIEKKANGSSYQRANQRAANIDFPMNVANGQLLLSSGYSFPSKDCFRDQEVIVKIAVPKGKKVWNKAAVVYPYSSENQIDQTSHRAYIYTDGKYSAW